MEGRMGSSYTLDHWHVHVSLSISYMTYVLMHRLWIPLKPLEEETDPEKAQKLSEMIAILREVRLYRLVCDRVLMIDGTQVR
jgi:hypothetical protein